MGFKMIDARTVRVTGILPLLLLLCILLFSTGCSDHKDYIKATVPHMDISFYYPESFVDIGGFLQEDSPSPHDIWLYRSPNYPPIQIKQEMVIVISNWVYDRNLESSLYKRIYNTKHVFEFGKVTFLEDSSIYNPVPSWDEFIILERPVRKVAGIEAEYLVYSASNLRQVLGVKEPAIARTVLFEHDESVWEISIYAASELANEAKDIYDILIDSFKFLD